MGVSKDSEDSHARFLSSCSLSIGLLTDTDLVLHRKFATLGEKKMFGKVSK